MLKKIPFFKNKMYLTEDLPLQVFKWLMIATQIICIVVLLVSIFYVVLTNTGSPVSGSLGTFIDKDRNFY
ncbi:hypothetical protein AXA88_27065 [Salmonella enterica]|nr:hypothetical protein [Salmonella enterica]EAX3609477.1 hypothetical protein [Salmonella enterica]EGW6282978.1 hypothetical protein [Salmonella enterica]EGX3935452.1 hypothetical protein [Salmonella enterica]